MPDPCDYCPAADCDGDDHTDDCPNADAWAYLDPLLVPAFIEQHTKAELFQLRCALNDIERAMTVIHRHANESQLKMLNNAIGSIWDNASDIAFDELFSHDISDYTTGDKKELTR